MTERHHYKYIVLDSSKENGNAVQAKFNVQIPHGITNTSKVTDLQSNTFDESAK